jgi:hypothetical protein
MEDNKKVYLKNKDVKVVQRIHMARGGDRWWAFVNMTTNSLVPQKAGNFLTSRLTIISAA